MLNTVNLVSKAFASQVELMVSKMGLKSVFKETTLKEEARSKQTILESTVKSWGDWISAVWWQKWCEFQHKCHSRMKKVVLMPEN